MSRGARFAAKMTDSLEIQVPEVARYIAAKKRLKGQVFWLIMEKFEPKRSNQANKRHWGLIVPLANEVLSQGLKIPLSNFQVHELLCRVFLGEIETPLGTVRMESHDLPADQFAAWQDRIAHWLLHDHGLVVPATGDSLEDATP